ncbi:SDR family oxidoreductase [Janthinobacterium sp.]|uniref:SDR family NAD(P)-dependent oxidoreductase n=1 Tax=Janthinobacterium sp. TaxID=1871054 RepID=UPI002585D739|nr:SDR family oxidoreductase [Janthinobacterium sp.]MCX7290205.1 SDR family NAD(P)-dependent oxidoreductase [Janthinobacterium sp.]
MRKPGAIIITGGSRGLGQAFVRDTLAGGHIVATCSRNETAFIRELRAADPDENRFCWRALDITNGAETKKFVKEVARRYGAISGLVNNAGYSDGQLLTMMNEELLQKLLSTNLEALIRITHFVAPYLLRENGGSIVNIGSISGKRGFSGMSIYGATKSALDGFSRCLARELGERMVRVNVVAPGLIATEMADATSEVEKQKIIGLTPMGRFGTVADVVGVVRFLLSDDSAFITGQSITVDGGFTC